MVAWLIAIVTLATADALKPAFLFAYGTLKPGLVPPGLASLVARLDPVAEGRVRGRLYDLGPYPGLVLDPGAPPSVRGTILRLPDTEEVLARLDRYEGDDFHRTTCEVQLEGGATLQCWVYEFQGNLAGARLVESGQWHGHPPRRI